MQQHAAATTAAVAARAVGDAIADSSSEFPTMVITYVLDLVTKVNAPPGDSAGDKDGHFLHSATL